MPKSSRLLVGAFDSGSLCRRRAFEKFEFEMESPLPQEVVSAWQRLDICGLGLRRSRWSSSQ